jgi:hypothetical protein
MKPLALPEDIDIDCRGSVSIASNGSSAPRWLWPICPYGPKENLGLPTCTWCRDGRLDACAHASALRLQLIQTA